MMRLLITFLIYTGTIVPLAAQFRDISRTQSDSLDAVRIEYIARYKDFAIVEMIRGGVPASITLAQGILETSAGSSTLCREANNHFGHKCGKYWSGNTHHKNDDEFDKNGAPRKSCFRAYDSAEDCYADHTAFLRDPQKSGRYGFLFALQPTDYISWAQGLQSAGYSPVSHYASRLVEYIERYQLQELDTYALQQIKNSKNVSTARRRLFRLNNADLVFAQDGETPAQIAQLFDIDVNTLLAYNDNYYKSDSKLRRGSPVFLEVKHRVWVGEEDYYYNSAGFSVFEIAQHYGLQLEALRALNGLSVGQEPATGAKIRVQGARKPGETVKLRPKNAAPQSRWKSAEDLSFVVTANARHPLNETNTRRLESILKTRFVSQTATNLSDTPDLEQTLSDSESHFHRVESGQTLIGIARQYGTTVDQLRKLNQIKGDTIRMGQMIRVK